MVLTSGIFVTERTGTPFRKLFLRRTQVETAFRNFFPGIDITKTFPSPTEFWVNMRSGTFFL
jgi:hypothetical protein